MLGFIEPLRSSSNTSLQNLIDKVSKTPTGVTKTDAESKVIMGLYKALNDIYEHYIKSDSVPTDSTDLLKYINTGICHINIGESTKPTREVYFMIDLIEGEINDNNKSSIYCPYTGNLLGNQLEYLINVPQTKQNKWAVDKNRQMFSLSKMEKSIEGNDYKHKMEERDSNPSKNIGYNQLNQPNKSNEKLISTEVSNNFTTYILKDEKDKKDKKDEVEKIIENLRHKYMMDNTITSIDKSHLLESMQKLGELSNKLIGVIIQWSKDMLLIIYNISKSCSVTFVLFLFFLFLFNLYRFLFLLCYFICFIIRIIFCGTIHTIFHTIFFYAGWCGKFFVTNNTFFFLFLFLQEIINIPTFST
jgi:hypothetical protein